MCAAVETLFDYHNKIKWHTICFVTLPRKLWQSLGPNTHTTSEITMTWKQPARNSVTFREMSWLHARLASSETSLPEPSWFLAHWPVCSPEIHNEITKTSWEPGSPQNFLLLSSGAIINIVPLTPTLLITHVSISAPVFWSKDETWRNGRNYPHLRRKGKGDPSRSNDSSNTFARRDYHVMTDKND